MDTTTTTMMICRHATPSKRSFDDDAVVVVVMSPPPKNKQSGGGAVVVVVVVVVVVGVEMCSERVENLPSPAAASFRSLRRKRLTSQPIVRREDNYDDCGAMMVE